MSERLETADIVSKMVSGLSAKGDKYALGYLESFITGLIDGYVNDPIKLEFIRIKMLAAGIDSLIDVKKIG